ncbi:MAG TPA: monovalent cation/H(+) antiporter subunit G [Luteimonas sp.]|nr:monovalent cation/H(+) antiporter subunit G [Luteimonas sp.]
MNPAADLPAWAALLVALFVVVGAGLTFIGSVGLLRLRSFYERLHAPTLGTTLGTGCVLIASIVYFSVLQSRPVIHEIVIGAFLTLTTPVSSLLLIRAVRYRDRIAARGEAATANRPPADDRDV